MNTTIISTTTSTTSTTTTTTTTTGFPDHLRSDIKEKDWAIFIGFLQEQEINDLSVLTSAISLQDTNVQSNDFQSYFKQMTIGGRAKLWIAIRSQTYSLQTDGQPPFKKQKMMTKEDALNFIRNEKYSLPVFPKAVSQFYERNESLEIALNYIDSARKKTSFAYDSKQQKFILLGTSGMKGIGKTELMKKIGEEASHKLGVKALYVTFNGTGAFTDDFLREVNKGGLHNDSFAQGLLISSGVPVEIASLLDYRAALVEIRLLLGLNDNDSLLICVDEIGELQDHAERTLTALMRMMDSNDGKLIFIFSHIMQSFLDKASTGSGRPVNPLPLPPLPIDIWKNFPELKEAAIKKPSLHQLFLSCCGHPRSIFDGISKAIENNPTLLSDPTEEAMISARCDIIRLCKFNDLHDPFIEKSLLQWFSLSKMDLDTKEKLKNEGFLQTMKRSDTMETVEFPFTLLVQNWATRQSKDISMAYHLQQIYAADSILGANSEKWMELVMYHYEAVLRIAQGTNNLFPLRLYYPTEFIMPSLHQLSVSAPLPITDSLVYFVDDFNDTKALVNLLNLGFIVVSKKQTEIGVEYFVPFYNNKKLIVAAVQCKFVKDTVDWAKIKRVMAEAIKDLEVEVFPVLYTTVDQYSVQKKTYSDGVYFTEESIFMFTSKLGILRLHTQKLGQKLKDKFPLLERASSGIDLDLNKSY